MEGLTDTIAAPITPPGRGAVAIVRVSGPAALQAAATVTGSGDFRPRKAHRVTYTTGDDGLATYFPHNASYTGEDSIELSLHGSPASVNLLLQALCDAGCRPANPGEFTLRAFMNGKIDLAEAEGVRTTVDSMTARQLEKANLLRSGATDGALSGIHEHVATVLGMIEAATDFSEETGDLETETALSLLESAQSQAATIMASQRATRILRQGITVSLLGKPNAGKSSLFNRLLATERSIVAPVPGTTRDTVTANLEISGVPITLTDTAGLGDSQNLVEREGVARSLDAAAASDIIIWVYDAACGFGPEDAAILAQWDQPVLIVGNKCDLAAPQAGHIAASAETGEGLASLVSGIEREISQAGEPTFLLDRHFELVAQIQDSIEAAAIALRDPHIPDDVATVPLRAVLRLAGQVLGRQVADDVIESIFANFCIGK